MVIVAAVPAGKGLPLRCRRFGTLTQTIDLMVVTSPALLPLPVVRTYAVQMMIPTDWCITILYVVGTGYQFVL